jgi:hypothetical protein
MTYLSNDSDLFEYDPEEDISSPDLEEIKDHSNKQKSTVDDFLSQHKDLLSVLQTSSENLLDENKIRLATGLHGATSRFFTKIQSPTFNKSVSVVLDKLSNGDFSLINTYYRTEALIIQRLLFISLMDNILGYNPDKEDQSFSIKNLLEALEFENVDDHIKIFYHTSLNICHHSLTIDRAIYQQLGNRLGMDLNPNLIDPLYVIDITNLNNPVINDYADKAYGSILATISQEGLLETLKETFGAQIGLYSNEK